MRSKIDEGRGKSPARELTSSANSCFFSAAKDHKPPRLLIVGRGRPIGRIEDRIEVFFPNLLFGKQPNAVAAVDGAERFVYFGKVELLNG